MRIDYQWMICLPRTTPSLLKLVLWPCGGIRLPASVEPDRDLAALYVDSVFI
jgi:hypothetical protein